LDRALETVGLEPPGAALTRTWIGDGIEILIARALAHAVRAENGAEPPPDPAADADRRSATLAAFLDCYRENLFVRSRLYPEASGTLEALAAAGIRLCCVTNKRYGFSVEVLRAAGVLERFALVLGGDSLPEKKPSPLPLLSAAEKLGVAPSAAALVGDSHQDLRAARAAGYSFIWAAFGYGKIDAAEVEGSRRIARFADLVPLLAR
jgi:phosphoglycolate phosphatase